MTEFLSKMDPVLPPIGTHLSAGTSVTTVAWHDQTTHVAETGGLTMPSGGSTTHIAATPPTPASGLTMSPGGLTTRVVEAGG
jgi:hypothetical protein